MDCSIYRHDVLTDYSHSVGITTVSDFVLALWPIFIVSNLQMPLKKRLRSSGSLGLGLFASLCSLAWTVEYEISRFEHDIRKLHSLSSIMNEW